MGPGSQGMAPDPQRGDRGEEEGRGGEEESRGGEEEGRGSEEEGRREGDAAGQGGHDGGIDTGGPWDFGYPDGQTGPALSAAGVHINWSPRALRWPAVALYIASGLAFGPVTYHHHSNNNGVGEGRLILLNLLCYYQDSECLPVALTLNTKRHLPSDKDTAKQPPIPLPPFPEPTTQLIPNHDLIIRSPPQTNTNMNTP